MKIDLEQATLFPQIYHAYPLPFTQAGEILQDERRLNVAVTRAKHKLIMVGDMTTLNLYTPFKQLIDLLESSQIYSLKEAIEDLSWND